MTKGTKFKLPSASKAGMQKKQGRNFLLPKEKPKRGIGMIPRPPKPNPEDFPKLKPRPPKRRPPMPGDPLRPRLMSDEPGAQKPSMRNKLSPAEIRMIDNYRKKKSQPRPKLMSGPTGRTLSRTGISGPIGRTLTPKQRVEALKMKKKRDQRLKRNRK